MSRRKQLKPRHLEAEEDEAGPNTVKDPDLTSLQSIGLFRKRFLKFEDYNNASTQREETSHADVLMGNDSISKIMRDVTMHSQALGDEVTRCPSVDVTHEGRMLANLDKTNDGCSSDDGHNMDSGEFEELRGMDEIDFRDDEQTGNERDMVENGVDQSCDDSLTNPVCSLPPPAPPFGVFSFTGDPSVKLSSIGSTDVAVAQFAENNILPSDLAVLNLVLLNLQQQQLFQMHLLQQLQQQLMYATAGTAPSPSSTMPNFASPDKSPPKSFLPDFAPTIAASEAICSHAAMGGLPSTATSSSSPSDKVIIPPTLPANPSFSSVESTDKLCSMICTPDNDGQNPDEVSVPPIMAMIGMSTRKLPFMPDKQLKEGGALGAGSGLSSDGSGRGPGGNDGHSSRNRCRFCQKVFSSDSALQIHIRSHTGERPYRCSICGNRFSTKGNLKVHFRCHMDTFSHLQRLDQKPQLGLQLPDPVGLAPPPPFPASPAVLPPLQHSSTSSVETDHPHRNKNFFLDGIIDQNPMLSEMRSASRHTEEQDPSPSTSQTRKTFGSSNWQEALEEEAAAALVPVQPQLLEKVSCFPVVEERDALPAGATSSSGSLPPAMTPAKSDSETPNSCKSNLLLSPPPPLAPPPLAPPPLAPPPPPLSLLSSMSSSFSAFPNPLFSSFSATHRPVITTNMAPAPVALRPFGFGGPPPGFFRSASLQHSKREDPLEQFMEVQKSETTKMEKLVQNIEKKLSDPNQCGICYRTLSCKSALQMHYRTHTGERPFRCKICGRAFTTKGNLKTHMGVHRAKPPVRMLHQCPVCHKQFTNALVLQQHIRMHTGELPKQLPYHPGGMMIVPPAAMGYLPPFPGYPFFPSGFNPGQQNPLLVPAALETLKHRSQFGNLFQHNNEDTKPERAPQTGTLEETELDDLSKMDESSSSSSSSVFSSKENGENEHVHDVHEMLRAETSQHSSLEDIDVESPNHDDKKLLLPSPNDDGDEEDDDDDMSCMQNVEPHERNQSRLDEMSSHNNESFMNDGNNVCGRSIDGSNHNNRGEMFERDEFSPLPPPAAATSGSLLREDDERKATKSGYLEFDDYPHSKYSSSLMALEEKVNEINVAHGALSMAHPLQQMEKIIKRTEDIISLHANHARPSEEHHREGGADMEGMGDGRRLSTPSSLGYRVKSSYSPVGGNHRESTSSSSHTRNFGFLLGVDKARRSFGSMDLSPKSFEAATGKPNTTCGVCYKTFACKSALDIHYRSHTKERPFQCRVCDRAFSTKGNMKQHMMTHKGCGGDVSGLFSSDASSSSNPRSCPPPMDDGRSMEKSEDTSLQSMPRTPVEGTSPPSDNPVSMNGSFKSEEVLPPLTPSAGAATPKMKSSFEEQSHPMSMSPHNPSLGGRRSALRHLCTVCQKPFSSASALQIHMRTHTGDRPFTCTVCNKAFTTKGNLKVHMGTHMWNNGPSRRGRRMSVEGIAGMAPPPPKSAEFFGGPSRIPTLHELYHFPFHGGFHHARFASPKLNEISVIQKMNGAMQHFLPDAGASDMMGAHLIKPLPFALQAPPPPLPPQLRPMENQGKCRDDGGGSAGGNNNTWAMNSSPPQRGNNGELDLSVKKSLPPLSSQMSPAWMWKTSCNLCSKVCSSPGALEIHMKSHPDFSQKTDSPKSVIA